MAVGRISGQLLKSNLLRNGEDIAFETDLLYIDVNNSRIGIKTGTPQYPLDVNGTIRTVDLEVTNQADIDGLILTGNSITTPAAVLSISSPDKILYNNAILVDDLQIQNNSIEITTTDTDLEIRPNGTGQVEIYSDTYVDGNIHATGSITADGNITLGDQDTDSVTINADINSDIIPDATDTYALGSSSKRWNEMFVSDLTVDNLTVGGNILVGGLDLTQTPGKIIYVAANGDDTNTGTHQNDPFATVQAAIALATAGDSIHIYPGTYTEVFPITVPVGVNIKGESLRSVFIQPTVGTVDRDAFILNGETTIEDLTVGNFRFNAGLNRGYAFRYATPFTVTTRSPYIRNVSVITAGSVTSGSDPRGFNTGDAGKGAYLDGSVATAGSNEASCLFQNCTFITPGVDAITMTNGVRVEWLNSFTYFANRSLYALDGVSGLKGTGKTLLKVDGLSGPAVIAGQTITYKDVDNTTVLGTGTIATVDGTKIYLSGKVVGFENATDRPGKTVTSVGNAQLNATTKKYGTASLALDGTGDYATLISSVDFAFPSTISRLAKTITVNGNAAVSATQSKFGSASLALDGTGDYVSVASSSDFGFGTGNFTIEGWFWKNTATQMVLFDQRTSSASQLSVYVESNASGNLRLFVNGSYVLTSSNAMTTSAWNHVAISRASGTTRLFINGAVSTNTYADTNNYGVTKPLVIGASWVGATAFAGYIDDFRVSNTARYTATFTPSTTAFTNDVDTKLLIHGDSTIVDDAGGGTATDFTIEGWIYPTAGSAYQTIFDFRSAAVEKSIFLSINTSNQVYLYVNGVITITTAATVSLSAWTHVALVRSNTSTKIYLNGTQSGSSWTDITSYGTTKPLRIGADYSGAYGFTGYIDDVRVVKGVALYTGAFVAPTTQLTTTPNTVLLLNFNGINASTTFEDSVEGAQYISFSGGATATSFVNVDYTDFGAEVRSIASASIYGNYGAYGSGAGVLMYLIGHNFAYIGLGKELDNDASSAIQANEVIELSNARIFYSSVDHKGDYRVGDLFYVNQADGTITFTSAFTNIASTSSLTFTSGGHTTIIDGSYIQQDNVKLSGNTIESTTGALNLDADNGQINLLDNVSITGDLDVTGNLTIGGNITIGDAATDTLSIVAAVASDIIPQTNNLYNLGSPLKNWNTVYSSTINVDGNIRIENNLITTQTTNSNLQLSGAGTGSVEIENFRINDNTITNTTGDMTFTPATGVTVFTGTGSVRLPAGGDAGRPGTPSLGMIRYNTDSNLFEGYNGSWVALQGVYDLDRNTYITAELTPGANDNTIRFYSNSALVADVNSTRFDVNTLQVDSITISGNTLTTTGVNQNLILNANGTGFIRIENLNFQGNTITNTVTNAPIVFETTGDGYVDVSQAGGFVIPYGNSGSRPSAPTVGITRYNTADSRVEIFDGADWVSVAGSSGAVSLLDATELSVKYALTLG